AEQLVATADGQDGQPVLDGVAQPWTLERPQVVGHRTLRMILTAPDQHEVRGGEVGRVAYLGRHDLEVHAAPGGALLERAHVATAAADAHAPRVGAHGRQRRGLHGY